jgi:hypothetical protein
LSDRSAALAPGGVLRAVAAGLSNAPTDEDLWFGRNANLD